jgi:hypothetical protein
MTKANKKSLGAANVTQSTQIDPQLVDIPASGKSIKVSRLSKSPSKFSARPQFKPLFDKIANHVKQTVSRIFSSNKAKQPLTARPQQPIQNSQPKAGLLDDQALKSAIIFTDQMALAFRQPLLKNLYRALPDAFGYQTPEKQEECLRDYFSELRKAFANSEAIKLTQKINFRTPLTHQQPCLANIESYPQFDAQIAFLKQNPLHIEVILNDLLGLKRNFLLDHKDMFLGIDLIYQLAYQSFLPDGVPPPKNITSFSKKLVSDFKELLKQIYIHHIIYQEPLPI